MSEIDIPEDYHSKLDELIAQKDISDVLFSKDDFDPMEFCFSIAKTVEEGRILKKFKILVEKCGGIIKFNFSLGGLHLIKFVHSKRVSFRNEDYFLSRYILDCAEQNKLQDLGLYRASKTKFPNIRPNDIILGLKSWEDARTSRCSSGEEVSDDFSEDEEVVPGTSTMTHKTSERRKFYTVDEERDILNFILKRKYYLKVKGTSIWQRMEEEKVCGIRTWQSMKERYLHHIIPRLKQFKISPLVEAKLLKPFRNDGFNFEEGWPECDRKGDPMREEFSIMIDAALACTLTQEVANDNEILIDFEAKEEPVDDELFSTRKRPNEDHIKIEPMEEGSDTDNVGENLAVNIAEKSVVDNHNIHNIMIIRSAVNKPRNGEWKRKVKNAISSRKEEPKIMADTTQAVSVSQENDEEIIADLELPKHLIACESFSAKEGTNEEYIKDEAIEEFDVYHASNEFVINKSGKKYINDETNEESGVYHASEGFAINEPGKKYINDETSEESGVHHASEGFALSNPSEKYINDETNEKSGVHHASEGFAINKPDEQCIKDEANEEFGVHHAIEGFALSTGEKYINDETNEESGVHHASEGFAINKPDEQCIKDEIIQDSDEHNFIEVFAINNPGEKHINDEVSEESGVHHASEGFVINKPGGKSINNQASEESGVHHASESVINESNDEYTKNKNELSDKDRYEEDTAKDKELVDIQNKKSVMNKPTVVSSVDELREETGIDKLNADSTADESSRESNIDKLNEGSDMDMTNDGPSKDDRAEFNVDKLIEESDEKLNEDSEDDDKNKMSIELFTLNNTNTIVVELDLQGAEGETETPLEDPTAGELNKETVEDESEMSVDITDPFERSGNSVEGLVLPKMPIPIEGLVLPKMPIPIEGLVLPKMPMPIEGLVLPKMPMPIEGLVLPKMPMPIEGLVLPKMPMPIEGLVLPKMPMPEEAEMSMEEPSTVDGEPIENDVPVFPVGCNLSENEFTCKEDFNITIENSMLGVLMNEAATYFDSESNIPRFSTEQEDPFSIVDSFHESKDEGNLQSTPKKKGTNHVVDIRNNSTESEGSAHSSRLLSNRNSLIEGRVDVTLEKEIQVKNPEDDLVSIWDTSLIGNENNNQRMVPSPSEFLNGSPTVNDTGQNDESPVKLPENDSGQTAPASRVMLNYGDQHDSIVVSITDTDQKNSSLSEYNSSILVQEPKCEENIIPETNTGQMDPVVIKSVESLPIPDPSEKEPNTDKRDPHSSVVPESSEAPPIVPGPEGEEEKHVCYGETQPFDITLCKAFDDKLCRSVVVNLGTRIKCSSNKVAAAKTSKLKKPSERSKKPPERPKNSSERSKTPPERPKNSSERFKTPPERPKNSSERSKTPPERPKNSSERSKTPPERPKNSSERSKTPPERPKNSSERSKTPLERPKNSSERSKKLPERPENSSERSKKLPERPENSSERSKKLPERPENSSERSKKLPERPENSSERSKTPPERPKNSSERSKKPLEIFYSANIESDLEFNDSDSSEIENSGSDSSVETVIFSQAAEEYNSLLSVQNVSHRKDGDQADSDEEIPLMIKEGISSVGKQAGKKDSEDKLVALTSENNSREEEILSADNLLNNINNNNNDNNSPLSNTMSSELHKSNNVKKTKFINALDLTVRQKENCEDTRNRNNRLRSYNCLAINQTRIRRRRRQTTSSESEIESEKEVEESVTVKRNEKQSSESSLSAVANRTVYVRNRALVIESSSGDDPEAEDQSSGDDPEAEEPKERDTAKRLQESNKSGQSDSRSRVAFSYRLRAKKVNQTKAPGHGITSDSDQSVNAASSRLKNYLEEDDIEILKYIYKNRLFEAVRGKTMWEDMEKRKILPGRTWHSLKERFRKRILPRIKSYKNLSTKVIESFLECGRGGQERSYGFKRSAIKYSSPEDKNILDFIIKYKRYKEIKGKAMWVSMSKCKDLDDRSWESLKNRFLHVIAPNLHLYRISKEARSNFERVLKGNKNDTNSRGQKYSEEEDMSILDFIIGFKRFREIKGKLMWVSMAENFEKRTWESLKTRFLHTIVPNLRSYNIGDEARASIEGVFKREDRRRLFKMLEKNSVSNSRNLRSTVNTGTTNKRRRRSSSNSSGSSFLSEVSQYSIEDVSEEGRGRNEESSEADDNEIYPSTEEEKLPQDKKKISALKFEETSQKSSKKETEIQERNDQEYPEGDLFEHNDTDTDTDSLSSPSKAFTLKRKLFTTNRMFVQLYEKTPIDDRLDRKRKLSPIAGLAKKQILANSSFESELLISENNNNETIEPENKSMIIDSKKSNVSFMEPNTEPENTCIDDVQNKCESRILDMESETLPEVADGVHTPEPLQLARTPPRTTRQSFQLKTVPSSSSLVHSPRSKKLSFESPKSSNKKRSPVPVSKASSDPSTSKCKKWLGTPYPICKTPPQLSPNSKSEKMASDVLKSVNNLTPVELSVDSNKLKSPSKSVAASPKLSLPRRSPRLSKTSLKQRLRKKRIQKALKF